MLATHTLSLFCQLIISYRKVSRENGLGNVLGVDPLHEVLDAGRGLHVQHGGALDLLELEVGLGLLRGGQPVHVVENVDGLVDGQRVSHLLWRAVSKGAQEVCVQTKYIRNIHV